MQAFLELEHHVLYVHPLMWALTLVVVCVVVVIRGAKLENKFAKWIFKPILRFVAHVFGGAAGAIPVVLALAWMDGSFNARDGALAGVVVALSLLNSTMALLGIEAAGAPNLKVREAAQWAAFFLVIAGLVCIVKLSNISTPSEKSIPDFAQTVVNYVSVHVRH